MPAADAPVDLRLLPARAAADARGRLSIAGVDLVELAGTYGTPLYVYDEDELRDRCRAYRDAFGSDGYANVSYASKAFLCDAMARLVAEEGLDLDVASGGEAHVATRAGFPPSRMVFHGNNKSDEELRLALSLPVGRLVIDGFDELDRVEALVDGGLAPPEVLLRVTPGIDAHTHEHIATGGADSKFGFTLASNIARDAAIRASTSNRVHLVGFHCHIGSQLLHLEGYEAAADAMAALAAEVVSATGRPIRELNLGGGLGVAYTADEVDDVPSIAEFARFLVAAHEAACARFPVLDPVPRLAVEAGRSIAAPAGLTLYRVGAVKTVPGVDTFVAVDGGMSDNPRPITYGARYEAFLPARATDARPMRATVAGKHCEQGDLLVRGAQLPVGVAAGDVLATPVTGAYAHSMASNYNLLLRPAVVFVRDGEARVVVRRETLDDLVARDVAARDKTEA
ncbi:MAG: diaminopimelate decarboxylase [Acidimicrobiia bacterium]